MSDLPDIPTDNLYKFFTLGALAIAVLTLFYLLREQARLKELHESAQVQLLAGNYQEGSTPPTDPELRKAYFQDQFAISDVNKLMGLASGFASWTFSISIVCALVGFGFWWGKVQRYDDAILRHTAEKLEHEVQQLKQIAK